MFIVFEPINGKNGWGHWSGRSRDKKTMAPVVIVAVEINIVSIIASGVILFSMLQLYEVTIID